MYIYTTNNDVPEKTKDQHAYLSEAVVYKKISRGLSLKHQQSDSSDEISETEVAISILADLLERQFMECEQYLQKLAQNVSIYCVCRCVMSLAFWVNSMLLGTTNPTCIDRYCI